MSGDSITITIDLALLVKLALGFMALQVLIGFFGAMLRDVGGRRRGW